MIRKELHGYPYAVFGSVLFDTVPAEYAGEWLAAAPEADTLILCDANPFPKTVKRFLEERPGGKIYAPHYTAYTLKGILGDSFRCELVRGQTTVGGIALTVTSRPGRGSYLIADCCGGGIVSGEEKAPFAEPSVYDRPTVAIAYVSGCDYTETIAEKIAGGIRDSEGLETVLIDLASMDTAGALRAMAGAEAVLIGTPSAAGEADKRIWDLLTAMSGGCFSRKFASAFGSYTWNGEAVPHVIERMKQLKMNLPDGGFTVQYRPGEAELSAAYEYGYYFGCKLQNKPNSHRSGLVKCLVCGEIFEASLGICPVCGVGLDKCVHVEDEEINFKEDTDRHYVILGGGTAALSAASAIRKRDRTGAITMLSAEDTPPINRPMLTKNMVVAARVEDSLLVRPAEWFEENKVELRLNTCVTAIDPQRKTVMTGGGEALPYDKLIYALGAECAVPDIPGKERDGVFTIRHLSDVKAIWKKLPGTKTAAVIGGGVLGLEAAAELKKARLSVTVLEMAPRLMSRQIDDETSDRIIQAGAAYGIKILTGVNIAAITGDGVQLVDGTVFPAQIVVLSCGIQPNVALAKAAGIDCERAVTVTPRMETNLPDIYAAGDCAEYEGVNYQLWAEATEQGRIAGANAAGDRVKYQPVPYGASFEGMNTASYAIGDVGRQNRDYRLVEFRDEVEGSYRKYWFFGRRLLGGILYGNMDRIQLLTEAVTAKSDYVQLKGKL